MRKRKIAHEASLILFLLSRNRLSSDPFPFGFLDPKAARSHEAASTFRPWTGAVSLDLRGQALERFAGPDERCWVACRGLLSAYDYVDGERVQLGAAREAAGLAGVAKVI